MIGVYTNIYSCGMDFGWIRRRVRHLTEMNAKRTDKGLRNVPERGRADLPRLRRQTEEEIARTSPPELADLPADFWEDARVVTPPPKEAISIRLDEDVLEWFRAGGPGYQTRMNAVLRSYMKAMKERETS